MAGKEEQYIVGSRPYDGAETFVDSASSSEARFQYYQKKRNEEPLFQTSAASYGWFRQAVRLNRHLRWKGWHRITCPVLVFQAERETYVSKQEQEWFVRKLNRRKKGNAKLVIVPGLKHEIFNSGTRTLECYWWKMQGFLEMLSEMF